MRTRAKICGVTRVEDALAAAAAGTDAVGLVFYPPSKRVLSPAAAQPVAAALPPFVTRVALFLDPEPALVAQVLHDVRPDVLQFHGSESPEFCAGWGLPFIKSLGLRGEVDLPAFARRFAAASGFLLDGHAPGEAGGTGQRFDWSVVPIDLAKPWILAGGLQPANVAAAIRQLRPYGVDVSSGVEQSPGLKDPDKIYRFMQEVQRVDCQ